MTNLLVKEFELNKNGKYLFIVPTELLESQIIYKLKQLYPNFKNYIGSNIILNNIIVCTPEKLSNSINLSNNFTYFDFIVIDEAHSLIDNNNERNLYLKHLIKTYFENEKSLNTKLVLISPLINEKEFNKLEKRFNQISFHDLLLVYKNIDNNEKNNHTKWIFWFQEFKNARKQYFTIERNYLYL